MAALKPDDARLALPARRQMAELNDSRRLRALRDRAAEGAEPVRLQLLANSADFAQAAKMDDLYKLFDEIDLKAAAATTTRS